MNLNNNKTWFSLNKNNTYYFSPNKVYIRLFSSFEPRIRYNNAWLNKSNVLKENKGKSGVYRWVNKLSNETYIGSSVNLTNRLGMYYSVKHLKHKSAKSRIYRALLKYGYENFHLEILEYCNKESVIRREQYYINLLNPEYNILKIAGSTLGFKHSSYTKLIMSNLQRGERNSMFNKKHTKLTRESISLAMKGRPRLFVPVMTDITRTKISKANLGRPLSEEHKYKISLALKGRVHSEETRRKLSMAMLNKKPNMETLIKWK